MAVFALCCIVAVGNGSGNGGANGAFGDDIRFDGARPGSIYALLTKEVQTSEEEVPAQDLVAVAAQSNGFDRNWLQEQCAMCVSMGQSGLSAVDLSAAVFDLLTSSNSDDQLQGQVCAHVMYRTCL